MQAFVIETLSAWPTSAILLVIAAALAVLSKGADLLVDNAVILSLRSGIPKVVIGATVVSLGTTLPEAAVSIFAAIQGNPDLALGNAVGSIICNTALIIGASALIRPLPVHRDVTDRQGWIQFGVAVLLVVAALVSLLGGARAGAGAGGWVGRIPQWVGLVFIAMLVTYLVMSIRQSRSQRGAAVSLEPPLEPPLEEGQEVEHPGVIVPILLLALGVGLVVFASRVLIPAVEIVAGRAGIPQSIIAATLVALGTSLPELTTAITASRKGHGELAVGNVIGANILNVLFVVGASAAVTAGGLAVPTIFFALQFPAMLVMTFVFRGVTLRKASLVTRTWGVALLVLYVVYIAASYAL
ncbi:MAG: calcium/sodium antiporter [Spirochaetota bacterium]